MISGLFAFVISTDTLLSGAIILKCISVTINVADCYNLLQKNSLKISEYLNIRPKDISDSGKFCLRYCVLIVTLPLKSNEIFFSESKSLANI